MKLWVSANCKMTKWKIVAICGTGTKGSDPSVYVLLYMLGGMWLDFAAECAAVCERSPTAAFLYKSGGRSEAEEE